MTTQITMMDRDEFIAFTKAEREDAENENEIAKLRRQLTTAQGELTVSEVNLRAIETSLACPK